MADSESITADAYSKKVVRYHRFLISEIQKVCSLSGDSENGNSVARKPDISIGLQSGIIRLNLKNWVIFIL